MSFPHIPFQSAADFVTTVRQASLESPPVSPRPLVSAPPSPQPFTDPLLDGQDAPMLLETAAMLVDLHGTNGIVSSMEEATTAPTICDEPPFTALGSLEDLLPSITMHLPMAFSHEDEQTASVGPTIILGPPPPPPPPPLSSAAACVPTVEQIEQARQFMASGAAPGYGDGPNSEFKHYAAAVANSTSLMTSSVSPSHVELPPVPISAPEEVKQAHAMAVCVQAVNHEQKAMAIAQNLPPWTYSVPSPMEGPRLTDVSERIDSSYRYTVWRHTASNITSEAEYFSTVRDMAMALFYHPAERIVFFELATQHIPAAVLGQSSARRVNHNRLNKSMDEWKPWQLRVGQTIARYTTNRTRFNRPHRMKYNHLQVRVRPSTLFPFSTSGTPAFCIYALVAMRRYTSYSQPSTETGPTGGEDVVGVVDSTGCMGLVDKATLSVINRLVTLRPSGKCRLILSQKVYENNYVCNLKTYASQILPRVDSDLDLDVDFDANKRNIQSCDALDLNLIKSTYHRHVEDPLGAFAYVPFLLGRPSKLTNHQSRTLVMLNLNVDVGSIHWPRVGHLILWRKMLLNLHADAHKKKKRGVHCVASSSQANKRARV